MKIFKEYILPVIITIAVVIGIRSFIFTMVNVSGSSMEPNLNNDQRVMVWRQAQIKRLSVVVFDSHGVNPSVKSKNYYVKRVIGMPGDTITKNGDNIYVNNKKVDQNFISQNERDQGTGLTDYQPSGNWDIKQLAAHWDKNQTSVKVPEGQYFVLGDHRSVSDDSRYFGFVPKNKMLGVVKTLPWGSTSTERYNVNSLGY